MPQETANLVTFTEETLNEKLSLRNEKHFCAVIKQELYLTSIINDHL